MKVLLFLPDGVGLRNFALSGFLEEAAKVAEVEVLSFTPEGWAQANGVPHSGRVSWASPPAMSGSSRFQFLRQTLLYAHMRWAGTVSMRHNLNRPVEGS